MTTPKATNTVEKPPSPKVPASDNKDETASGTETPVKSATDRLARFKALQARAKKSADQNLKEAAAESQRLATDTSALTAISRKHAIASHNLLKADAEEAGEDFERKRAWDWTAEEAERWDRRQEKKAKHRGDVAFQDYTQEARKNYKRQMRGFEADKEAYEAQKAQAVQKAAASGGLELVETEDGEIVAVDKTGTFHSSTDGSDFINSKPSKEGIDRLVNDLKKAEEQRLKQRKNRKGGDDDPDVTYINDKNKQFNQKLARYYDKYTTDIRESFERGTMI